ncbi:MAG: DNA polymerase III subunit gamma/tau [Clostridia bacterium]|nr:DNA polymerase III subunit gamma/tau [Clostridia bacterium]
MAYQALYRKYRPKTFSDVCGQEHITKILESEIESGKIGHAYLFTGTRGTGKTTCAKILSRAVNCENPAGGNPCGECAMCRMILSDEATDVVEIDAASNNGVDNIRELREQVVFSPAVAKYRVYIIDEVHMLSSGAFNALLKTLEEPPEHVVFILATTEVHKLPATILSRCQRFDFRRIDSEVIANRLKHVAKQENLTLTDDAATLIAAAADGGMRDALSILDLCAGTGDKIDESAVASVCSMAGNDYLLDMADYINSGNADGALTLVDSLHNSSVDMTRFLGELTSHFRNLMIMRTVSGKQKPIVCSKKHLAALEEQAAKFQLPELIAILNILQNSAALMPEANRRALMEMTLLRLCTPKLRNDPASLEMRIAALEADIAGLPRAALKPEQQKPAATPETAVYTEPNPEKPEQTGQVVTAESDNSNPVDDGEAKVTNWQDIIEVLKIKSPLIAGVLEGSAAYIKGGRLLIDTQNTQFKTLVNGANPMYREAIKNAAFEVLGKRYNLGPYNKKSDRSAASDPLSAFAEKLKSFEV